MMSSLFEAACSDKLAFFLCGILALQKSRSDGGDDNELGLRTDLDTLYSAPVPYTSDHALSTHATSYLQPFAILPGPVLDLVTPANLRHITGLCYDNAFGIRSIDNAVIDNVDPEDPGSELLEYALYAEASIFNHSCLPNVRKLREGRVWKFGSNVEVKIGEEVCITYLGGDERL